MHWSFTYFATMKNLFSIFFIFIVINVSAQKKPLDHSVYDQWQSFGERYISNNGSVIVYTINPQEGDGKLYIKKIHYDSLVIDRGFNATITPDGKYVICKIRPFFKDTRDAKIKKKKQEEMPKDSLAIITIADWSVEKIARVKNYKTPEKSSDWLAWQTDNAVADKKDEKKKDTTSKQPKARIDELFLRSLTTNKTDSFNNVSEYLFNDIGTAFVYETAINKKDSTGAAVNIINLSNQTNKTILKTFADAKSFAFDEAGKQLAFVANVDTNSKAVQKYYGLYYFKMNNDTAIRLADKASAGMYANWSISENGDVSFSKSGKRILFGTAPVLPVKDTSLPEFERVNVDVWNYKDDYLQTVQLKGLDRELKRSYLAVYDLANMRILQHANENMRVVQPTMEGDGKWFYAGNDSGYRAASQWQGYIFNDVYAINSTTGQRQLIQKKFKSNIYPSYTGNYLLMYDEIKRKYFVWSASIKKIKQVGADIKYALYDEDNDMPDDPSSYGFEKWTENDEWVLIKDRYDVWAVDPNGINASARLTNGRAAKTVYDIINTDKDEKYMKLSSMAVVRGYNEINKSAAYYFTEHLENKSLQQLSAVNNTVLNDGLIKAKDTFAFAYTQQSFTQSPQMLVKTAITGERVIATTNPQQQNYNWGTAELFKWTSYTGKLTEGVLYKPENFDPKKKYPMIVYFYERNNQTLHNYIAPAPTPSRLNPTYFVSNGYIVFIPDIWYKTGKPGQGAYDYIVSGTRALIKKGFIDSTKIGLQGQSWGGYQTVHLITRTNLYKGAWAGAPVVNMFSAYGGIRWESGMNRQFQYEHSQSRIGATIWQRPDLYIENSPLFHLPKVKTPLVIMANDADGAVPWYQGIELFTALRRLDKPVWMLNYNGEAHNLVERKNRKDISQKEQDFFDWQLKGAAPAAWLQSGVPAIMKGREIKADSLLKKKIPSVPDSLIGKWQLTELVNKTISVNEKTKTYSFDKDGYFIYSSDARTVYAKYYFVEYTNQIKIMLDGKELWLFNISFINKDKIKIEVVGSDGAPGIAKRIKE